MITSFIGPKAFLLTYSKALPPVLNRCNKVRAYILRNILNQLVMCNNENCGLTLVFWQGVDHRPGW